MPDVSWRPVFACPACGRPLLQEALRMVCGACESRFDRRGGIFRFLLPERWRAIQPFLDQYRAVREQDGFRSQTADYYRRLPSVRRDHPQAGSWRVREETYWRLGRHVLRRFGDRPAQILDLGAGNGWLSNRLSAMGHRCVALDCLDDADDGLAARRHYTATFVCVQADFDALPFAPGQFDLVAFNGSLHYSPHIERTLRGAARMLTCGGSLLVMDSPMFRRDIDGRAMLERKEQRFRSEYRLSDIVRPGVGYLTRRRLREAARRLRLRERFFPSRGELGWAIGRMVSAVRMGRAPATFGLWVAR